MGSLPIFQAQLSAVGYMRLGLETSFLELEWGKGDSGLHSAESGWHDATPTAQGAPPPGLDLWAPAPPQASEN